jgi:HlyD family secretion protein
MNRRIIGLGLLLLLGVAVYAAVTWMEARQNNLPDGIVWGNGRLEADHVDIAAKLSGRVQGI